MWRNKIAMALRGTKALRRKSNFVKRSTVSLKALAILLISVSAPGALAADLSRDQEIRIVTQIQRADYEGDRAALKRLYGELAPPVADNKELVSRVRYWRGFALWRRAINGFNDKVDRKELEEDLQQAVDEFDEAARKDPGFVDAKVGALSCLGFLAFALNQTDPVRVQEWVTRGRQMRKDAEALAPDNPRLLWVMGVNIWWTPPERGGGQAKAIEAYEKGLEVIRKQKGMASDALEPTWGEPELLMSLAWCELNRTAPDVNASEQYARSALGLVPYWHYVKDILMPQIQAAKKKAATGNPALTPGRLALPATDRGRKLSDVAFSDRQTGPPKD